MNNLPVTIALGEHHRAPPLEVQGGLVRDDLGRGYVRRDSYRPEDVDTYVAQGRIDCLERTDPSLICSCCSGILSVQMVVRSELGEFGTVEMIGLQPIQVLP